MPTFCRHGRLQANCPICSKDVTAPRPARPARSRPAPAARTPRAAGGLRVRRVERAPDDGYEHDLVPGLRATADAGRLARELAFADARLRELAEDPPGLYAQATSAAADEGAWLALLIAYLGPARGDDPWSQIEAARTAWAGGDLPRLQDARGGPRTSHAPGGGAATFAAYRVWAQRHGGQLAALRGEPEWEPTRRFARAFERLALPGRGRGARFDFLVTLGALRIVPVEAGTLALGAEPADPVVAAAKRVLGIGDAINLERRAAELARGVGVPLAALDLALFNWAAPEEQRATMGARRAADPAGRARIAAALGAG